MPPFPTIQQLARLPASEAQHTLDFIQGELHLLLAEDDWGCRGAAHYHTLIRRRLERLERMRDQLGL